MKINVGSGLIDELLKETIDPMTGRSLGCWATINTQNQPEKLNSPKMVYDLKAQGYQSRIITTFIDMVTSKKLRLLESQNINAIKVGDKADYDSKVLPFVQTDLLIEEISNLKLVNIRGGLTVQRVVSNVDKDRFSALSYVLFYINEYCESYEDESFDMGAITSLTRKPKIR